MNSSDLTAVFQLFGEGILYGIPLGTLGFMLGFGVSALYNFLFRSA